MTNSYDHYQVEDFSQFRNKLLNDALLWGTIIATPGVAFSLSRIPTLGWIPIMWVHLLILIFMWSIWIYRERLSYHTRAVGILGPLWLATIGGIITLGPASGAQSFSVIFSFIVMLFLTPRTAWIIVGINIACLILLGILASHHVLHFNVDFDSYAYQPSTWFNTVWSLSSYGTLLAYIVWRMMKELLRRQALAEELINAQHQNLSALAIAEKRLSATLESSPSVAIQWYDTKGHVLYWNHASELLYGWSAQEAKGKTLDQLIYTDETSSSEFVSYLETIAKTGQPIGPVDATTQHKDGSPRVVSSTIFQIQGEHSPVFVCMDVDITERKKFEEELKRSNSELEQFSYAISHDMRHPLRMISSYIHLIEMKLKDKLDQETLSYFDFASNGAKRIDQMLVDLLEYSRFGRKGSPLNWIESHTSIDEALLFLQPLTKETQAQLNISGDWPKIYANRDEMLRLFQNLISNAIKYRKPNVIPEITITSTSTTTEWRVCLSDNGIGIDPAQINRLFKVFQRLQSASSYEGTGVGLALCRKIVEYHGGHIWIESAGEGLGSQFHFALPLKQNTI